MVTCGLLDGYRLLDGHLMVHLGPAGAHLRSNLHREAAASQGQDTPGPSRNELSKPPGVNEVNLWILGIEPTSNPTFGLPHIAIFGHCSFGEPQL